MVLQVYDVACLEDILDALLGAGTLKRRLKRLSLSALPDCFSHRYFDEVEKLKIRSLDGSLQHGTLPNDLRRTFLKAFIRRVFDAFPSLESLGLHPRLLQSAETTKKKKGEKLGLEPGKKQDLSQEKLASRGATLSRVSPSAYLGTDREQ